MVSRRNFISIAAIMLVVFFMFQFTNVALEMWNNYDENKYTADVKQLAGRAETFVSPDGTESTPWGTDRFRVAYIGEAGGPIGQVVSAWAAYTKRSFSVSPTLAAYSPGEKPPQMLVLDGARLDWNASACQTLLGYAQGGTSVVFASLPDVSVVRRNRAMQDLLGIYEIRGERTEVEGIHLYKDFLLGGEVIYQVENEDDERRQDLDLVMPWYILDTSTKTYMKGIPSGEVRLEDHPAIIWRRSVGGAYVFAVNGDYMEDAAGLGILSAIDAEASAYSVYPVVNAQNLVVANSPGLATENAKDMVRYYSMSMRGVYRDILWPDITGIYHRGRLGLSCMMAMQFDYDDSALPNQVQFIYYMKMINELQAEAGLSGVRVSDTPITAKLAEDFSFMENAQLPYRFTSFYAGGLEEQDVIDALGWEELSGLRTVVYPYDGGCQFIGYETDQITRQMAVTDGFEHTFRSDLRMRGVETALAYTSVLVDALRPVYPESVGDTWGLLARQLTSDVPFYWKTFRSFDGTTVSECDGRIRNFLSMDYTASLEGDTIRIRHSGSGPAWFILRMDRHTAGEVQGGSVTTLEDGVFLIEAQEQEVSVQMQVVYAVPD